MSLVLRDIRHRYGAAPALDGVTLAVEAGEIVCLFGPSGCGKTTLLRIAAGLEPLQDGSVEIDGRIVGAPGCSAPAERRPIGMVFQDYVLFPHLTVSENIAFGLAGLAPAARAERIAAELAAVELADLADRFPHQLSGGQQQRAALARAFARRPRAMLLDEPFASIDVALRQRLRGEMRRLLKSRSTPALLVTHDPAEAIELGDRIAVMRDGRIVETASPEALYRAPATAAGAALFPGSQTFACRADGNGVATAFGRIAPLAAPPAAAVAVVHQGGARLAPGADARAVDCRFAGPDWLVTAQSVADPTALLRAHSAFAVDLGQAVSVAVDPAYVRLPIG
jgi:iron(III) transport system ATP-binding protein